MTLDEAVRAIRADPGMQDLVRDAFLGRDVADSYRRFLASTEFSEVLAVLGGRVPGADILDLGAGTGVASNAFGASGARRVVAVEPDPSDEIGRGAMARGGLACEIVDAAGEQLPFADASFDIAYCRAVLHHARDLDRLLAEVARVLRPGGLFLATREHVVRSDAELEAFLAGHPEHVLAGSEHAYRLDDYVGAIRRSGLQLTRLIGPWDSVINTWPDISDPRALEAISTGLLARRFGRFGRAIAAVPGARTLARRRFAQDHWVPGAEHSFLCRKT
jgi:SAM-dependent methyltransferase